MSLTESWNGVSGIWTKAAKWSTGVVPYSNTAVTIDAAGSYWVAINIPAVVKSITMDTAVTTDPLLVQSTLTIGTDLTITSGRLVLKSSHPLGYAGGGIIEGGTISTGADGTILYEGGTLIGVTYQGTLDMSRAGSSLDIEGGFTLEGAGGVGPGTVDITGAGAVLLMSSNLANATIYAGNSQGSTLEMGGTLAASLNLIQTGTEFTLSSEGAINDGSMELTETAGITDVSGGLFTNNGTITLGTGNTLDVPYQGFDVYFTNNGTITIASNANLLVGYGFTNEASGVIDLNNGEIDDTSSSTNDGTINVSGNVEIAGNVAGTGTISLAAGAGLELSGAVASTQTVALAGTGSVLELGTGFAGSISGLAEGDAILLQGIAAASAVISGNDLVITPAIGAAFDIALSGNVPSSDTPVAVGSVTNGDTSVSFISIGGSSYTLAAGGTISGGEYDNLIVATADSLTAADDIDAGSGSFNAMILSGAGTFDLAAPATLTGVADFFANEGQAASGDIASTEQIIDTRAGMTGTITVEAGTDNGANANPMSIVINGADDSMTFDFSNAVGSDTVNLGSGNETVIGTTWIDYGTTQLTTINAATAAEAGASIVGYDPYHSGINSFVIAAQTVLHVEAGGVITLGVNDRVMTVDLSNHASTLNLGGFGFIVANGGAGNDLIRAGGANQMLSGGGGMNILVGSNNGQDVFSDTSADLNGDTIKNFVGSDTIVATDMTFNSVTEDDVNWTQISGTQGVLSFTDGTHSVSMTLKGNFLTGHGFYVRANTDGPGVVAKYL